MYEKLNSLRSAYDIAGIITLLIYIMLCFGESNSFLVIRVITSVIALTAYFIKCGAEVISDKKLGNHNLPFSFLSKEVSFCSKN